MKGNIFKRLFLTIFVLFICTVLYAGKLYTADTEHFRLIYPEESLYSADFICKSCEGIYSEVADFVGFTDEIKIPVYFDTSREIFNASYSHFPSNRITIYDTVDQIGDLTNYEHLLLDVFKHELTHALQIQKRQDNFQKKVSNVLGDWFSAQLLELTPFYLEGSAVTSESSGGYGRLNNNETMQVVKQACIEQKFPVFFECTGMRDIYPSGDLYYIFGGDFVNYLKVQYGEEKLRSFFEKTGTLTLKNVFLESKFKEVFGISQQQAWDSYTESILLPSETKRENRFNEPSIYSNLVENNGRLYVYDTAENSLCTLNGDSITAVLTSASVEYAISFGSDGSSLSLNSGLEKSNVILRNADFRKIHTFKGYKGGAVTFLSGKPLYCLYGNNGHQTFIDVFNGSFELIDSINLGFEVYASDFRSPMDGIVAFIISDGGHENILILDVSEMKLYKTDNPSDVALTSLNSSPSDTPDVGLLTFSWTTSSVSDALVRYGQLEITKGKNNKPVIRQSLSEVDINGSIKYPVLVDGKVTYIGTFFKNDDICYTELKELNLQNPVELNISEYICPTYEEEFGEIELTTDSKYNPFSTFFDGAILPVPYTTFSSFLNDLPIGLSYYTEDPSGKLNFIESAGWMFKSKKFFSLSQLKISSGKSVFATEFEFKIPDFNYNFSAKYTYTTSLSSQYETLSATAGLSGASVLMTNQYSIRLTTLSVYSLLSYSNLRKTGMHNFDYSGLSSGILAKETVMFAHNYKTDERRSSGLNPVSFEYSFSSHFPGFGTVLSHSQLGFSATTQGRTLTNIGFNAEIVPLCMEIQNGLKFMGLWFNRFILRTNYNCNYRIGLRHYSHTFGGSAVLTLSEAIGQLADTKTSIGVLWEYPLGQDKASLSFYSKISY